MAELQSQIAPVQEQDEWLRDARTRTLEISRDLSAQQLVGPYRATINPILWALGHVAWFEERWVWRNLYAREPLRTDGDYLYDSFEVEHPVRWKLPFPNPQETLGYLAQVQENVLGQLHRAQPSLKSTYFHRLVVLHEDMHGEAITYDRATLEYRAPPAHFAGHAAPIAGGGPLPGDVEVPGSTGFALGSTPDQPYVWDNEKWAHPVSVAPFRIARAPVTNAEYAAFVEAGGYRQERHWSAAAWRWLREANLDQPSRWRRATGGGWEIRSFDRWSPLCEHHPVINVCWHEAQAYCRWAGRRLPTEVEWELAASTETGHQALGGHKRRFPWGDESATPERANLDARTNGTVEVGALPAGDSAYGCRQMLGNVWEWVEDAFYPYPGFVPDPYREYSAPWFGYHKVLRGGCWATRSRLVHNAWRNFFMPTRDDVFAGFRTCAR